MIIQNFNWKHLDYINYKNYEMAAEKLEITNEGLEKFFKSKMFIEQTNAITDYLFGKNKIKNEIDDINNINNENGEKKEKKIKKEKFKDIKIIKELKFNIINKNKIDKKDEEKENNIIDALKNEKALLFNSNSIYSFSLENKNISKLFEKDKNENLNENEMNKNIYKIMCELKNNLSNKIGNYNILIWKKEDDLKKDGLINLIKNDKKKEIKKFKTIQISDNNNFSFLKQIKKIEKKVEINEEKEGRGSGDNLLFSENNSLFNSNINRTNNNNNSNRFSNGLFNNNINNDITNLFTNFNSNYGYSNINNGREIEREEEREEYVYISRTGAKYHGRPTCGRMKTSSKVTISKAKALGLTPCMKCY